MKRSVHGILIAAVVIGGVVFGVERSEAHNPFRSKYTYNDDIFPIVRDRCGRCHVPDGVAPMSLVTYRDAFAWGESLRSEIMANHMPPWHAQEGAIHFKNAPAITAAEIDKILQWSSGGSPQGNLNNMPPPVTVQKDWALGKPDLELQLPTTATLAANVPESTQEFTLRTRTTEPRWIRAVDLLPGTPAIVRNAIISVKSPAKAGAITAITPERVLAEWVPGEDPITPGDAAFRLPAGAELTVRIHYRKTYSYEGKEMTDRSTVGLYYAVGPSKEIQRLDVASAPVTASTPKSVSFSKIVTEDLQALAFSPDPALTNVGLQVDAVSASGARTSVIRLAVRPNWTRRYWFDQPLSLPRGTRIVATAVIDGADPLLPPAGAPLPPQAIDGSPVHVLFDVVSRTANAPAH